MNENNDAQVTRLSKAKSLEEIADFWDTHSLSDHWDQTHEVEFDLRVKQRRRVTLTPDVFEKIEAQARLQGVLPETLVNVWLAERLQRVE